VLAGPNETPAGDADGQGVASVMLGAAGQVCFSILARLIAAPTAAHIHEGNAGVASGPIRVTLTTPAATGVPGTFASSGCVAGQDTAVLARLRAVPTNFYINVHNGPFPGGAIRGQLF
jgi:CHRD domain